MKLRSLKMAGLLVLPMVLVGCNQHTHTFSDEWSSDDTYHWHAATCEHQEEVKDKAEHTWGDPVVTKAPTCTEDGVQTYTCTVCDHTKTEPIDPLGHLITDWEIQHNPLTMTYEVGETLDLDGLVAKGICENCGDKFPITNSEITVKYNTGTSFVVGDTSVKLVYKQIEKVLNGITINKPKNDFDNIPEYSYETICGVFPDTSKATPKYDDDGEAELTVGIYKGDTYQEDQMVEITDPKDLVHDDTGEVEYWVRLDVNETTNYAANRKYVGISVEHDMEEPDITDPTKTSYSAFDYFNPAGFKIEISCSGCSYVETITDDDCFFVNQDDEYLVDPWGTGEEEVVPLHVGDQILCQYGSEEIDLVEECGITISKVTEEIENFTSVATTCCCEPEFATAPTGKYGGVEATVKYYDSNDGEGTEITDWSDITADSVGTAPVYAQASLPATTDYDAVKSNFIEVSVTHDHNWVVGTGQDDYKCACGDVSRSFITHVDGEFNFGLSNSHTTVDVDLTGLSGQGGVAYTVDSYDPAVTKITDNVATVNGEVLFANHVAGTKETKSITFVATETVSGDTHNIPVTFTCVDNLITNYEELKAVTPTTSATQTIDGYFMLDHDLDLGLSKTNPYFDSGFPTIASGYGFIGTFDGNGHTIDHFYTKGMGLFTTLGSGTDTSGKSYAAVVKNVKFTNAGLMNISLSNWARAGYAPLLARTAGNANLYDIDIKFEYIDPNYNPSEGQDSIVGSFLICQTASGGGWCRMERINVDATCAEKVRWAIGVEDFNANASCGTEGGALHDPVTKDINITLRDYTGICRDNASGKAELTNMDRLKGFTITKVTSMANNVYLVKGASTIDTSDAIGSEEDLAIINDPETKFINPANGKEMDWENVIVDSGNTVCVEVVNDGTSKGHLEVLVVDKVMKSYDDLKSIIPEADPGKTFTGYYVLGKDLDNGGTEYGWKPWSTYVRTDRGLQGATIDGRNHTIKDLYLNNTQWGIFGYLGNKTVIKDISFTNVGTHGGGSTMDPGVFPLMARWINGATFDNVNFSLREQYGNKFCSMFVGIGYGGMSGFVGNSSTFKDVTIDAPLADLSVNIAWSDQDTIQRSLLGSNAGQKETDLQAYVAPTFDNCQVTVKKLGDDGNGNTVYGYSKWTYGTTDVQPTPVRVAIIEKPEGLTINYSE